MMQDLNSPMVKMTSEATKRAMEAKARLQIEAQEKRVADTADETRSRVRALVDRLQDVLSDVAVARDLGDQAPGRPHSKFSHDGASIDDLLAALHSEVESLRGLRQAERISRELGSEFEARFANLDAPEPAPASAIPMGGGQYL